MNMAWKKGPLPKDTWFWGAVVPVGQEGKGFYFADFLGDRVNAVGYGTLYPEQVALYDNSIQLPQSEHRRAQA
jgi:hypothetical protein